MNLRKDRLTIMLVLTALTVVTLILNLFVGSPEWIIIVLALALLAEIIWFVFWLNDRGRS